MSYQISGLPVEPFTHLFGKSDEELHAAGARRYIVDARPGFPCRVTLEDAMPGEPMLLVNFTHLSANTPYRSSHAIFVRENASLQAARLDYVPDMMRSRLLSVRAFDANEMMLDADVVEGNVLEALINDWLANPQVAVIHVHTAKRGCYLARIERAPTV